jgi:hypothetical protein
VSQWPDDKPCRGQRFRVRAVVRNYFWPPVSHLARASEASSAGGAWGSAAGVGAAFFFAFHSANQFAVDERRARLVGVVVWGRGVAGRERRTFMDFVIVGVKLV